MTFECLKVNKRVILGEGIDEVGEFDIVNGHVYTNTFSFDKIYRGSHTVFYKGHINDDLNIMQGEWEITKDCKGSFEIKLQMKKDNKLVDYTDTLNAHKNQTNSEISNQFFYFVTSNSKEGTVIWRCPWRHVDDKTKWHKDLKNQCSFTIPKNDHNEVKYFFDNDKA